jgi:hypothetical protein
MKMYKRSSGALRTVPSSLSKPKTGLGAMEKLECCEVRTGLLKVAGISAETRASRCNVEQLGESWDIAEPP